tara:strand:- start:141 stop:860 length:720 start_codon:yes stop_codon:yes gene_type:complete
MRFIILLSCVLFANVKSAQINFNKLKNVAAKAKEHISTKDLTQEEVVEGLKEALILGTNNSTAEASKIGGFNNNLSIRILFPEDAEKMKKALVKLGMQSQIEKFEFTINEAAEDASYFAKEIFLNAVKAMTINDAMSVLKGDDNAATIYFKQRTSQLLYTKFKPIIKSSIDKVNLTKYWQTLILRYNAIPFTQEVNTDLADYVTNETIEGLFILIAKEEINIRKNPKARVTDILQKVFK